MFVSKTNQIPLGKRTIVKSYGKDPTIEIIKSVKEKSDSKHDEHEKEPTGNEPKTVKRSNETKESLLDIRIGHKQDGMFHWEPFHIQISMVDDKKIVVRIQVAQMMTASLFVQPFKWFSIGVITLTVWINGYPARAIYDPGCVGLALSKWFVDRNQLKPDEAVTMTILGSEGASTLD